MPLTEASPTPTRGHPVVTQAVPTPGSEWPAPARPPFRHAWLFPVVAVLFLWALHPLAWGRTWPHSLWIPAQGLALCLVAWFGYRALVLFGVAFGMAFVQALVFGTFPASEYPWLPPVLALADGGLQAAQVALIWWVYHSLLRGARNLGDPRSATLFILLGPGAVAGAFAALQAWAVWYFFPGGWTYLQCLGACWLAGGLGLLVLSSPLLAGVTPLLVRYRLAVPEVVEENQVKLRGHFGSDRVALGDWLETIGLAAGAGFLGAALAYAHTQKDLQGWQLWAAPLLIILWANLRQGLRGGTIVASAAVACPLVTLRFFGDGWGTPLLIQANLLAQCGTGLLAAASANWIRVSETRYRQVVGHIPVVVYSARITRPGRQGQLPQAEITLVSAASTALFGAPPEQLLGEFKDWLERVHPDDRELLVAAVAQLARQQEPVTCEYRLNPEYTPPCEVDTWTARDWPSTNGTVPVDRTPKPRPMRWMRDTLAPSRDAEGRLIGWEGVINEITEQRTMADDLRRTTSMFHALVSNLPAGVFFIQGKRGRPLLVNARARHLLGQRQDSCVPLEHLSSVYRLFRPDGTMYPSEELPVCKALRQGLTTMRDDIVVHRPDGRRIPLVTWAAPVSLSAGPPDAAVWVLEDLTALHAAEAARRDSEGRLRTVIETMGEGLIVQDKKGVIIDCNPAAAKILGYGYEHLRDKGLGDLDWQFLREDGSPLPADQHPTHEVLRTGKPVRNLILGVRPNRETVSRSDPDMNLESRQASETGVNALTPPTTLSNARWLLVNAMPLGSGPLISGVVLTFSDITAYRQAQGGMTASEERYRRLIESLPLMLMVADRDLRIVYANPAVKEVSGYSTEEISEPEQWRSVIHPDDLTAVATQFEAGLAGHPGRREFRYRAKDGTDRVGFLLTQPQFLDGGVVGLSNLIADVTRERKLEEELQRAQRQELVARFAGGIAHDFNNLLTVILSLTELTRTELGPEHPSGQALGQVIEASQQAANLAGQLIAFSRHRRAQVRLLDLNEVVPRGLDLVRATLRPGIALESRLAPEPLPVEADETQLHQVLMNLCVNAREVLTGGGVITVETAREGGRVRLSVRDTGPGMSEEVRARIFEPFFSTKERGTGLGLAVVLQIVESLRGRIEVTSQPGQGSCFDVWLPAAKASS